MATAEHFLDRYLDPVASAMPLDFARKLVSLQPDPDVVARVQLLAEKCNEGALTDEERDEYQALADAGTLIALLKAKARRILGQGPH